MTPAPARGRRALVAAVLTVVAVLVAPAASSRAAAPAVRAPVAAASAQPAPFEISVARSLTATAKTSAYLGSALSGVLVDADDGTVVWQHNPGRARMPASVQKLFTAYAVLHSLDPASTLATSTCRAAGTPSRVYLRGGGDPSLSTARIGELATATAQAVRAAGLTRVSVHVDGSTFPAPTAAAGWTASYLRSEVQLVRGLTLAWYRKADGDLAAGRALAAALARRGVAVSTVSAAAAPAGCGQVAVTRSATVGRLVTVMLGSSNNDYAEFLLRHAARARGYAPSWQGARRNAADVLKAAGVPTAGLQILDGSGLSRSNRVTVGALAAVLRLLLADRDDADLVFAGDALPVAGETGTLRNRFVKPPHDCARGDIQAKTGSLVDVVSLAGVVVGVDDRVRVFVLLDTGSRRTTSVRAAVDTLATTMTGCSLQA